MEQSAIWIIAIFMVGTWILALAFLVLIVSYLRLLKLFRKSKEKESQILATAQEKADAILAEVNRQALDRIEDADHQAQRIIGSAGSFIESMHSVIEAKLLELYDNIFVDLQEENRKVFAKVAGQIKDKVESDMSTFSESLKESVGQVQGRLSSQFSEDAKKLDQELEAYKKLRIAEIEEETANLAGVFLKQTVGKSLSREDHKKLVLQALEKANSTFSKRK